MKKIGAPTTFIIELEENASLAYFDENFEIFLKSKLGDDIEFMQSWDHKYIIILKQKLPNIVKN